jgi:hypothetical protein
MSTRLLLFCSLIFSFTAWPNPLDKNLILAQQLNQGLTQDGFRKLILAGPASTSPLTSLALNYLKSKRGAFLAYARGEHFCYQYLFFRECFRPVGDKQIQFLGNGQKYRLSFNHTATDLADAVDLEPIRDTAALPLDLIPKAAAQSTEDSEFKMDLFLQFKDLQNEINQRAMACIENALRARNAVDFNRCAPNQYKDLIELERATNTVVSKELLRLRASALIYTQSGWVNLKKTSVKAFQDSPVRKRDAIGYECGAPLRFGGYTVEPSMDSRVFKVKTDSGGTYVASFISSSDLDLNKCVLKARTRWPFMESCLQDNAIETRIRPLYDTCRIVEFSCKIKPSPDVLYIGQCESADCSSLVPQRSNLQNKVALANRVGLKTDLAETMVKIQESMLITDGLTECCDDPFCRNKLLFGSKVRLGDPPAGNLPSLPRPDGKSNGVKETDL